MVNVWVVNVLQSVLKVFLKAYDQQGQRKVAGRSEAIRGPR